MKKIELDFLSSKQSKELILFIILSIVIVMLDFSFVFKMQWRNLLGLKPQLVEARKKIKEFSGDVYRADTFKRRLGELEESVTAKKKGIIEEESIPAIMNEISKIADSANLKIMQIKPQKEMRSPEKFTVAKTKEYYILPIYIIAQGPYHALGKFLNSLESSQYFIKVVSLDIVPQAEATLGLDIKLSVNIYVVKNI